MDAGGSQPDELETLMPARHPLELFVTVTDFHGYSRDLVISDPPTIRDTAHRHVLAFEYGDGTDQFDAAHNGALAFAARSTMSFPGAFPPVSLAGFQNASVEGGGRRCPHAAAGALPNLRAFRREPGRGLLRRRRRARQQAVRARDRRDQAARRRTRGRPAAACISSRIPGAGGRQARRESSPSPIATVLASVSGLPRQEPLLDDIQEVNLHNERVRRIADIIETSFESVGRRVAEIVGTDLGRLTADESPEEVARWRDQINAEAKTAAGFAYATYVRTKVSGVAESFARTICRLADFPDLSNQAGFVRNVVRAWAEARLLPLDPSGRRAFAPDTETFLRRFDLAYRARRLRFVTDGLSGWYRDVGKQGYPTRAELNEGKRILEASRGELLDAMDGHGLLTNLTEDVLAVFAQAPIDAALSAHETPDEYAAAARSLTLRDSRMCSARRLNRSSPGPPSSCTGSCSELSAGWAPERRAELLVRYLGFPFWDLILYPIQSLADAGERDAIEVVRMSPRDAKLLPPLDPDKPKLAGFATMHFGAFFDRAGRERDYLWGRLDGAERMIGLLLGDTFTDEERDGMVPQGVRGDRRRGRRRPRRTRSHSSSTSNSSSTVSPPRPEANRGDLDRRTVTPPRPRRGRARQPSNEGGPTSVWQGRGNPARPDSRAADAFLAGNATPRVRLTAQESWAELGLGRRRRRLHGGAARA